MLIQLGAATTGCGYNWVRPQLGADTTGCGYNWVRPHLGAATTECSYNWVLLQLGTATTKCGFNCVRLRGLKLGAATTGCCLQLGAAFNWVQPQLGTATTECCLQLGAAYNWVLPTTGCCLQLGAATTGCCYNWVQPKLGAAILHVIFDTANSWSVFWWDLCILDCIWSSLLSELGYYLKKLAVSHYSVIDFTGFMKILEKKKVLRCGTQDTNILLCLISLKKL